LFSAVKKKALEKKDIFFPMAEIKGHMYGKKAPLYQPYQ